MAEMVVKNISEITIGDRVRKLVGDVKKKQNSSDIRDLMNDLEENGQIQPIVINNNQLVAGFRRLTATAFLMTEQKGIGHKLPDVLIEDGKEIPNPRKLPPGHILAIEYNNMTDIEKLNMEISENKARKDFTSAELSLGYARLKQLMEKVEGRQVSIKEVAQAAGVSKGQVTMGLKVADAIKTQGKSHLLQSSSVVAAYNRLNTENKIEELKKRAADTPGKLEPPKEDPYKRVLFLGDAIEWLKKIPDNSVDFVNFDPPWGIDIDSYDRWNMYEKVGDDEAAISFQRIIRPMVPHLYRVLKPDTYMVVWFGMQFYEDMVKLLQKAGPVTDNKSTGFKVRPVPSIWYKTNKGGAQSDSSRIELNVYEPFLICEKGSPRLFKSTVKNVYPYPMPTQRIHFNQKDVDLQVDILERYTFGSMVCIDPTFGSGSFLRACQRLGRKFYGCEKNETNYNKALEWLKLGVMPS